ncbi:hypothetical protein AB9K41_21120 [Cribrihabitans sp. XS_ASV171]
MKTGLYFAIFVAAMFIAGGVYMIDFDQSNALRLPHLIVDEGSLSEIGTSSTGAQSDDSSLARP